MCFGAPKQPNIVYQGPSDEELKASQASLDLYKTQMAEQQAGFQKTLQAQIDAANKQTADLQSRYEKEQAAAVSAAAAQQTGTYATAVQTAAADGAQTTAPVAPKKKPSNTLKIGSNALEASAGTGLNIGV